jgi:hypothetical protein
MKKSPVTGNADVAPIYFPMPPVGGVQLPFSEAVQLHDTPEDVVALILPLIGEES